MDLRFSVIGLLFIFFSFFQSIYAQNPAENPCRSDSLIREENHDSAITLGRLALEKTIAEVGSRDTAVAGVLSKLAGYYRLARNYAKVDSLLTYALEIREKFFGAEHPDIARNLFDLACLYNIQGRHELAVQFHLRALDMRERILGPENADVANSLFYLALVYRNQNKLPQSEQLYRRALSIRQKLLGSNHPDVAQSLSELAFLSARQGKYAEAKQLYEQTLEIKTRIFGAEHFEVAKVINNLGQLCHKQNRYAEAEQLYKRAIGIKERILGREHPDLASSLVSLGELYGDLNRYAEAEELFRRSVVIYIKEFGPIHPAVAGCYGYLGRLYYAQDDYARAEELYRKSLDITEKYLGPDHLNMINDLINLANVYMRRQKYSDAEFLLRHALEICAEIYPQKHPVIAEVIFNLAFLHHKIGDYEMSESLYDSALAINKLIYGPGHDCVAENLEAISDLRRRQKRPGEALRLAEEACKIRLSNFEDNAFAMCEKDALAFSRLFKSSVNRYISCYLDFPSPADSINEMVADIIFSTKGQVSDRIFESQRAIVKETDSVTQALAESLRSTKFQLSRLYIDGPDDDVDGYRREIDSLTKLANNLESELSRRSASYGKQKDYRNVSADRIASLLPEKSVLVEYLEFDCQRAGPLGSISQYLAIVQPSRSRPEIIRLGNSDEIDALVREYGKHMRRVASAGTVIAAADRDEYRAISNRLYHLIWKPVEKYIENNKLVIIAPDGELNLVSFAGIINDSNRYLIEEYPIHYLSSGRDIIRLNNESVTGTGLFALGDPDFDAPISERLPGTGNPHGNDTRPERYAVANVRSACGELSNIFLSPLPGTRREIESIISKWKLTYDETASAYRGVRASEDIFKSKSHGCRVIHLATHGYFLGNACNIETQHDGVNLKNSFTGENPLLLSGLFLAGANLHGKGADSAGIEDGILTAYEVSAMDLEGTDLVVLSACETGLGEIHAGEGVYGLRRALQMAGVRTVISALWPLSDQTTSEMLGGLYESKDLPLPYTIRRIQLAGIHELRRLNKADHPVNWSAFIVAGDWR